MDQFRDDIRSFLAAAMTPALARAATLGLAYDRQDAAAWHRALFEQGWAAPRWPVEHGGTGWSDEQHRIIETELALAGTPQLMPTGVRMVGPVIYTFWHSGTERPAPVRHSRRQRVVVSGLLGAGEWIRSGNRQNECGPGWRCLRGERPEDMDHQCP